MRDVQGLIFSTASHWSTATSLVVFAAGLLCTLQGFRFARVLLPLCCAGGGFAVAAIAGWLVGLPVAVPVLSAAALGLVTLARPRLAVLLASVFTVAGLAYYLACRLHLGPFAAWSLAAIGLPAGFALKWVWRRTLPIFVTAAEGAVLLVVGFVGLTHRIAPSLGGTFVDCAAEYWPLVPGLLTMLWVLGYAVQANALQGGIESGGHPGWDELEAT